MEKCDYKSPTIELSILLCALNEGDGLGKLLDEYNLIFRNENVRFEIVVIDGGSCDDTVESGLKRGALVFRQPKTGYGNAIRFGFESCRGNWILVVDADGSHPPAVAVRLWQHRNKADFIAASRFMSGAADSRPGCRPLLSYAINSVFAALFIRFQFDFTGAFRIYRVDILKKIEPKSEHFDIQPEIAISLFQAGCTYKTIPYVFVERNCGVSKAKIFLFGAAYLYTAIRLRVSALSSLLKKDAHAVSHVIDIERD